MKLNKNTILTYITIFISAIGLVLGYDSYRTKSQLNERDNLIAEMKEENSERSQKIDTLVRTITNGISFSKNGKTLDSDELISYIKNLEKAQSTFANEIQTLEDSLQYYKAYYELSQRQSKSSFSVKKDNTKVSYSLQTQSIPVDSANAIINFTIDEKNKVINSLYKEIAELKLKLSMHEKAVKKYGIEFNNIKRNEDEVSYIIEAPRVDSALLLLPYYRKNLKYNAKKGHWEIDIKKWL